MFSQKSTSSLPFYMRFDSPVAEIGQDIVVQMVYLRSELRKLKEGNWKLIQEKKKVKGELRRDYCCG